MDIQLKRGLLDVCVLAAIKNEDSYGYQIIKDMKPYVELSESTLYPILRRLEAAELLTVYTVERNGRLRKYYHITEQGIRRLGDFKEEWKEIMAIYRFLKLGFRYGAGITDMHAKEEVCRMFELCRNVTNESHSFREFVRFAELESGILLARIKPKNFVLPLMAGHFADRLPEEHFVIIDDNNEMGVFHERGKQWFLSPIDKEAIEGLWNSERAKGYEQLWKTFFKAIAIEQRRNYKCQRNFCALRYRDYMLEFDN